MKNPAAAATALGLFVADGATWMDDTNRFWYPRSVHDR
jgi:hypothetical protein